MMKLTSQRSENTLIIGGGKIGLEYARVLNDLNKKYTLLTRSKKKIHQRYKSDVLYIDILDENFSLDAHYTHAIICTNISNLIPVTKKLIKMEIPNILIEKPVSLYSESIMDLAQYLRSCSSTVNIMVAFNRRCYSHNDKIRKIINEDGGIQKSEVIFGEPMEKVNLSQRPDDEKYRWLVTNTIHLFDYLFWLCNANYKIDEQNIVARQSEFISKYQVYMKYQGILQLGDTSVSFHADWSTQTRWKLEITTRNHVLHFAPVETVSIKDVRTGQSEVISCRNEDMRFKPGFYNQTRNFIENNNQDLCDLDQLHNLVRSIELIGALGSCN
jgi:predicted dehydrogenase